MTIGPYSTPWPIRPDFDNLGTVSSFFSLDPLLIGLINTIDSSLFCCKMSGIPRHLLDRRENMT